MGKSKLRRGLWAAGILLVVGGAGIAALTVFRGGEIQADSTGSIAPQEQAMPVSVAVVEQRDITLWREFSGRLEAVERVGIRSRVSGAVQTVHFREGALVKKGDLLITIDPAPFEAEVARAEAQVAAADARVLLTKSELERGQKLTDNRFISRSNLDQRTNAYREAEANLRAVKATLQASRLDLGYTQVRAPVAGRVGRLEVTVGNLVAAGPNAPILTRLVSVDPIYASFDADEEVVAGVLKALGANAHTKVERIPVQMVTVTSNGTSYQGHLQLIDNQVDAETGTVRVRAVFDNADGSLMPGQFARLRMGQAQSEPALLVSERAVGTDQDKKYVMVVGEDKKAEYREVKLGAFADGLRVVTSGLKAGERIVVNGLQRVRPGAPVAPQMVSMDSGAALQAQASSEATTVVQR